MRDDVRFALRTVATRFSDDAPSVDMQVLRRRYAAVDAWPADAQLGLVVLAWVLGSGFSIAGFRDSVNRLVPNFVSAACAVELSGNPTLIALGGIVRCALRNGDTVVRWNLDPEVLYWPLDLSSHAGTLGAPRLVP